MSSYNQEGLDALPELMRIVINQAIRKVAAITEQLCGVELSSAQVSRATAQLDTVLETWRNHPLDMCRYVYLDARYEKVRIDGYERTDTNTTFSLTLYKMWFGEAKPPQNLPFSTWWGYARAVWGKEGFSGACSSPISSFYALRKVSVII